MDKTSLILETALLAGTILMESNAEAYRTEETMNFILQTADYERYSSVALTTAVFAMVYDSGDKERETAMERIRTRGNNLHTIAEVNRISREYTSGSCTVEEAHRDLRRLRNHAVNYPAWQLQLSSIVIGTLFSPIFSGGWKEMIGAFITSIMVALTQLFINHIQLESGLSLLLKAMVISLSAHLLSTFVLPAMSPTIVILSTLMPLVPGIAIVTSLRDIFREDYLSGLARGADALYQSLMIAVGTLIIYYIVGRVI